jgi:hypothetical protein
MANPPPTIVVNSDIVASTMDLLGYTRSEWRTVFALTAANIGIAAAICWWFIPVIGLPVAACVILFGLGLGVHLWRIRLEYSEHTLIVRNALERRLGVPETARHREGYVYVLD